MQYKSDIEIAQSCVLKPIDEIAAKAHLDIDSIEHYGKYKAKISDEYLNKIKNNENGKLILVTAINPTAAGEGKTTVTVGLGDALSTSLFLMDVEEGKRLVDSIENVEVMWVMTNGEQVYTDGFKNYTFEYIKEF